MDLTPKQQTSEAIRQAETILITSGQHPSMDQVASVIALTAILRKFGKKVSAVISDSLPQAASLLDMQSVDRSLSGQRDFVLKVDVTRAEVDKLRYEVQDGKLNIYLTPFKGGFAPSDVTFDYGDSEFDLAIILGVPTRTRIDRIYEQNQRMFEKIPVVNLDFHRSNENYGAVNLIEPSAASLCEMLVALAESLQGGIIDAEIATALLTGIMASTDRFTAAHTTPKSLTVAAQMMAAGARQPQVVRALYRDGKGDGPRGGDSGRGGDRGQARGGGQGGENRQSGASARAEQPASHRPEQPASRAEAGAPAQDQTPSAQPARPVAAPTAVPAAAPSAAPEAEEAPIIQPSHIEMSKPDEQLAPMTAQMAAEPLPMADFSSAAEVLRQNQAPERPAEPHRPENA